MLELSGTTLYWVIGGLAVGLIVEVLVFWAGCALADLDMPGYGQSMAIVVPIYLIVMIGTLYAVNNMGAGARANQSPGSPIVWNFTTIALISGGCFLVNIILAGLLYMVVLSTTAMKGLFVALMEVVLRVLMSALIISAVLVVLAGVQIYRA